MRSITAIKWIDPTWDPVRVDSGANLDSMSRNDLDNPGEQLTPEAPTDPARASAPSASLRAHLLTLIRRMLP